MDKNRRQFLQASMATAGMCLVPRAVNAEVSSTKQPVVVELFTSQGCSSCPPADRVLAELVAKHEQESHPVLGMSFHVDYWNYLGWSDPFSSKKWSARQRVYAKVRDDRVYTPQMIVNGQEGMVGSRRSQLEASIAKHVDREPEHVIRLGVSTNENREAVVEYKVDGDPLGYILNLALVARTLTAKASRGENAGRTLTHSNVVRDFKIERFTPEVGEAVLKVPESESTKHSVIAFVQSVKAATISGAVEKSIEAGS